MLDREAELRLIRRYQEQGDARAGEDLVRENLDHVSRIVRQYRHYGVSPAELAAEGNFGLVRALAKFDPRKGVRFMTYAAYWIRAYVLDYVIHSFSLVGSGSVALRSRFFFRLRRERSRISNLLGHGEQADAALAASMGLGGARLDAMLQRLDARDVSIDLQPPGGGQSLSERLPAPDDPERQLGELEIIGRLKSAVHSAVRDLDARERFIVESRLMADREEELSLAEIGRRLGVSRERARQIEQRAKKKLRARIAAEPAALAL
ncbi:MAG TPA: sigma-70 family RNA polymerase sigma factor [Polyangiaceae bacterium]